MSAVGVLGFSDRRSAGAYPVVDPQVRTVAVLEVPFWTASSFEAFGPDGAPIVRAERPTFTRTWEDVGPTGAPVATVRTAFWTNGATVTLPTGRVLDPARPGRAGRADVEAVHRDLLVAPRHVGGPLRRPGPRPRVRARDRAGAPDAGRSRPPGRRRLLTPGPCARGFPGRRAGSRKA